MLPQREADRIETKGKGGTAKMTRYHLIDAMRGASAVSMVLFHFLYDINMVYGHNPQW